MTVPATIGSSGRGWRAASSKRSGPATVTAYFSVVGCVNRACDVRPAAPASARAASRRMAPQRKMAR